MNSDEVKTLLKDTTTDAVDDGAFGLPFIIIKQGKDHLGIDDETFFGSDRFEVIAHKLGILVICYITLGYQIQINNKNHTLCSNKC